MAPQLVMPPIAGVLADRMSRRNLMAGTYAVNLFVNLLLAVLAGTGLVQEWQIILLSILNGAARATQMSTSQALAANLVPRERLLNALALNSSTQHASRLVGPGLATPLLGFFGAPAAFAMCTALYGVGWVLMMQIKTPTAQGNPAREGFIDSFTDGLLYAWGQPYIRMVLAMVFFHCGLTMAFESLLPNFTHQQLSAAVSGAAPAIHAHGEATFNADATAFSTLMMGIGLGAFVGGLLVGGIQSSLTRGRLYFVFGIFSGLSQLLLAVSPNLAFAFGASALMGASQAAMMTMGQATMQALAADEYRGRIASLNTLILGGVMSLMNLANGYFGMYFGAATILFAEGLLFVAIMLLTLALVIPRTVYVQGLPTRPVAAAG
jgi:MFS family permease